MKAPDKIYVEVCEDGIFAFPQPPFKESVEYIRAELVEQPLQQEQPEVDLEKELEEEIERFYRTDEYRIADALGRGFETLARHFAEWQYQKDRGEFAKLKAKEWSDGYNEGIVRGKEQAEQDLGWHSVEESLPEMDEDVIVLTDELGTAPIYKIGFGHIVDVERCIDYNGWNIPGVKYWMPCPEIPNE